MRDHRPQRTNRLAAIWKAWREQRDCHTLQQKINAVDQTQAVVEFTPDGVIVDANENFLRVVGYSRDDVVGQHHRMLVDADVRESEEYRVFWERLREGQHESGEFRRLAAGGREVWIRGSYSPIRNRLGQVHRIIKHAVDITEQRMDEADMESRLAAIHRAMAVITFDLDGNVVKVNDNFLAALGYQREEVLGQHHRMFVDREQRESDAYREFWRRLHRGEHNTGLYKRIRRDGSPIWIQASYNPILDAAGRPFKVVKLATDVTTQTLAAKALHDSLEQLNATVPAIAGEAQTASRLATEATHSANDGSALVTRLVTGVADINQHSEAMAEIIEVMNSIAFQTNILSLNAAVEAAHAGELGKGFAVVAQEVRALAQRSADSASEIQELVRNTTSALADCANNAQQAGESMQAITASSNEVGQLIRRIADDARSQADGLADVGRSIDELKLGAAA